MRPVVVHALIWGLILSGVLGALLLGILWANPEILLHDYPPDIRAKWGSMTSRTKVQRWIAAAVLLSATVAVVVVSMTTTRDFDVRQLSFGAAFLYFAVMFGTFNVVDWLAIDWGLVYLQPAFVILPGTKGLAGYRNYRFHFRGFLIGIPVVLFGSLLGAVAVRLFDVRLLT